MNWTTSHLASRKELQRATENERMRWKKRNYRQRRHCFRQSHLPKGNQRGLPVEYLLQLTKKCQVGWLEVTFLGKVDTAIQLGIKTWFAAVGLGPNTSDSIWGL